MSKTFIKHLKNLGIISLVLIPIIYFSNVPRRIENNFELNIFSNHQIKNILNNAGIFFIEVINSEEIRGKYLSKNKSKEKVKIMIVPGHDEINSGAQFGDIKESDMNVQISKDLYGFMKKDKSLEVFLVRDENGYDEELSKYFEENTNSILAFREENILITNDFVSRGLVKFNDNGITHNFAPSDSMIKLWGINKWANENDYDIVLHIHFNDYPGRHRDKEPKYSGFSIYVPAPEFSNSKASLEISKFIKQSLEQYFPVSNMELEKEGIIETHELIAIGSYNSLNTASILIEYGYIYEPHFHIPLIKDLIFTEMAFRTYQGLQNFFENEFES